MKEMVYKNNRKKGNIILDNGKYINREYFIINLGTHPCAYICLTKDSIFYGKNYDEIGDIGCHGGLTFSNNHLNNIIEYSDKYGCDTLQRIDRDWIIGWDYAHYGDYMGYDDPYFQQGKKWHTQEIQQEIEFVIHKLIIKEQELLKKEIIEQVKDNIYEYACDWGETPKDIKSWEELHDYALDVVINGERLEESNNYYKMHAVVRQDWQEMADEINDFIGEECQSYYGDPAFSSASDYWNYRLG